MGKLYDKVSGLSYEVQRLKSAVGMFAEIALLARPCDRDQIPGPIMDQINHVRWLRKDKANKQVDVQCAKVVDRNGTELHTNDMVKLVDDPHNKFLVMWGEPCDLIALSDYETGRAGREPRHKVVLWERTK
jgi:hypothetical protein